jgi:hypothetical protein
MVEQKRARLYVTVCRQPADKVVKECYGVQLKFAFKKGVMNREDPNER